MKDSYITSLLHRTETQRNTLVVVAFWTLAAITLFNLPKVHLWGAPGVQFAGVLGTAICSLIVVGLAGVQYLSARRSSVWSVPFWQRLVGVPGFLLLAAVASYLVIGAAVCLWRKRSGKGTPTGTSDIGCFTSGSLWRRCWAVA